MALYEYLAEPQLEYRALCHKTGELLPPTVYAEQVHSYVKEATEAIAKLASYAPMNKRKKYDESHTDDSIAAQGQWYRLYNGGVSGSVPPSPSKGLLESPPRAYDHTTVDKLGKVMLSDDTGGM
jgi:hypothetical protein